MAIAGSKNGQREMSDIINHYVDQQIAVRADLAGAGIDWLDAEREQALGRFRASGFPGQRDEDWRYMPLRTVTSKLFEVSVAEPVASSVEDLRIDGLDAITLVFVDGRFVSSLSSPVDGATGFIGSFPDALRAEAGVAGAASEPDQGFAALNLAFSADGYVISLNPGVSLDKPIEILCVGENDSVAAQPRNTIRLGRESKATVIERHVSRSGVRSLVNTTCRIELAEHANLDYQLVQELDKATFQVTSTEAVQAANSRLSCMTVSLGGGLLRNNLRVSLDGEGAHCEMLGLYHVAGTQHVDNHTTVIHAAPHCTSRELYKGVLDQRSRAVFHGRIKVQPDAQKTDATQANNNLLLSANAEVDTKPQLEIYADDVKCAHGATVGQIDETALFYLRSRGIDETSARSLMTFAFVNEVLAEIDTVPLRDALERALASRLIEDDLLVDDPQMQ